MNIITLTGIRPDFIRMSEVFRRLDAEPSVNHILIHTGQHFDKMLSGVFFEQLEIRQPDYNLEIGGKGKHHYHQTAELTVKLIDLIKREELDPDWIVLLGDSNSVLVAPVLKKEGYKVAHIEAGMRSGDRRMLEEINRIMCDHSSELLFTYHPDYTQNLLNENIPADKIECVGNTIVEVAGKFSEHLWQRRPKLDNRILLDIHRPENFKDPHRLQEIFKWAGRMSHDYNLTCLSLRFPRTYDAIEKFGINTYGVRSIELQSYKNYLRHVYDSKFVISDSGTAQEEPAILRTPVLVPRDFTERPQSYEHHCSAHMKLDLLQAWELFDFIDCAPRIMDPSWLGCGNTAELIVQRLLESSQETNPGRAPWTT